MTSDRRTGAFLGRALVISIALHAALIFVNPQVTATRAPKPPPELTVRLPPPQPVEPVPRLTLPETPPTPAKVEPRTNASVPTPPVVTRPRVPAKPAVTIAPPSSEPQRLSGEAATRALQQLARELPYPAEAVERGLQGEALVLIFLDAGGNAIAARLETSSGHAILDEAAVRAARQLRALPASAPREALLPVRFRLR